MTRKKVRKQCCYLIQNVEFKEDFFLNSLYSKIHKKIFPIPLNIEKINIDLCFKHVIV